jgi:hypothetical protein
LKIVFFHFYRGNLNQRAVLSIQRGDIRGAMK